MLKQFFVGALLTFALIASASGQRLTARRTYTDANVLRLFSSMHAGTYNAVQFPDLGWQDIPGLLKLGPSTEMLKSFPINPISSEAVKQYSEGMVAMWLIEGIRKGDRRFGSMNALVGPFGGSKDWGQISENNHLRVYQAYRTWWKRVKTLSSDQAALINPLEGTNLRWF